MSESKPIISFKPARSYEGKEWYVGYYVLDPATGTLKRFRIKINRIAGITERRKFAKKIVDDLNKKLYNGWSPFKEEHAPKGYTSMKQACEIFMRSKRREMRSDSIRSYQSFTDSFLQWLINTDRQEMYAFDFRKQHAIEYLDFVYNVKLVSNTTYNNYIAFQKLLFTWLMEAQYVSGNCFDGIRKKMKETKQRILIPLNDRIRIREYLADNDAQMLAVSMMIFYLLIRPKEISLLRPEYFHLNTQTIILPGEVTKNRKSRIITIPDTMMEFLIKWDYNKARTGQYIFGKNWIPGKEPINPRRFSKSWDAMRAKINLPAEMKLYSLKDSGIVQMLNDGISPQEVMKQADHSSLEVTTVYAKFINPKGSEQIKKHSGGF